MVVVVSLTLLSNLRHRPLLVMKEGMTAIQENLIDQSDASWISAQQENGKVDRSTNSLVAHIEDSTDQGDHVHSTRDDYGIWGAMKFLTVRISKCKFMPESSTRHATMLDSQTDVVSSSTGVKKTCRKAGPSGPRKGHCDQCNKEFQDLACHMNMHSGIKPLECKDCGRRFVYRSSLANHSRKHTGVDLFQCKECGTKFPLRQGLKSHMMTHSGEKPFACKECNSKFSRRSNLTAHMEIHVGVRNYECKECGKKYFQHHHLQLHSMVHKGDKPFQCEVCYFLLWTLGDLEQHMVSHNVTRRFLCKGCGKKFSHSGSVNRHWKLCHGTQSKCFHCCDLHANGLSGFVETCLCSMCKHVLASLMPVLSV